MTNTLLISKHHIKRFSLSDAFFVFSFLILLFQNVLVLIPNFSFLTYYDEFVTILMIIFLIFNHKRTRYIIFKKNSFFSFFYFLGIFIGLISSLIYKYQSFFPSIVDLFSCIRFYVAYIFFDVYRNKSGSDFLVKNNWLFILISSVIFSLFIIDLVFKIFPRYDIRYGLESIELFFGHPLTLSFVLIALVMLLSFNLNIVKINKLFIIFNLIVLMMTLRTASISFVVVYLICYFYINGKTLKQKSKVFLLIIFLVGSIFIIGYSQVNLYYGNSIETVRGIMLRDGFFYAIECFPFGLGFGTFGSNVANIYSSPIYLSNDYYSLFQFSYFSTDSFIALSLGQFGIFGTIAFILSLISIICKTMKSKKNFLSIIPFIIYVFISMFSTTSIFHPTFFMLTCGFSLIRNS